MRDSKGHLRLDRRLAHRRGWISKDELEKAHSDLPDLTDKGELVDVPGATTDAGADDPEQSPSFH